jgi:PAS domain S-box-containing protein
LRLLEFAISHTPTELLRATLDEAEALSGSQVGFCCFVDADQIALSLGAWSTNTVRRMDKADGLGLRYSVDQADICVDCIRKHGPVIHQGPTSLPHLGGSPDSHVPVVRELVVPVIRGGAVIAVFGVGEKPADYDEQDVRMVATLADLAWDIAEKKRAEDALRENRTLLEAIVNGTTDAVYAKDVEGRYLLLNSAGEAFVGKRATDILGKDDRCLFPSTEAAVVMEGDRRVMAKGETTTYEETVTGASGAMSTFLSTKGPLFDEEGTLRGLFGIARNITERKQAERYKETVPEILEILNEPGDLSSAARRALAALKKATDFEALGIRLKEGDDFPYLAQEGFAADFLQTENTLIKRSPDGGLCRDQDGQISLECTCGLVISGKSDPADPLISPGGSFWTNDSFRILDLPPNEDRRTNPRNRCMLSGYASMALVPIRTRDGIVGLLQLNDRSKGRFTLETIEVLEDIASHLGAALMRKRAEEALFDSQELFSLYLSTPISRR